MQLKLIYNKKSNETLLKNLPSYYLLYYTNNNFVDDLKD